MHVDQSFPNREAPSNGGQVSSIRYIVESRIGRENIGKCLQGIAGREGEIAATVTAQAYVTRL